LGQIECWCVVAGKVVMAYEFKVGGLEVRCGICGKGVLEGETGQHGEDVRVICCYAGDIVEGGNGANRFWDYVFRGGRAGVVLWM